MPNAYTSAVDAADNLDKQNGTFARNIIVDRLTGIEGMPYQFMDSVDRRPFSGKTSQKNNSYDPITINTQAKIGRKYTEKIISRMPLLFLTPCQPLFMDDKSFTQSDRSTVLGYITSQSDFNFLTSGSGKFYSASFAYARYYSYLNFMLASVAAYLGLQDEKVYNTKLSNMDWSTETQEAFRTYFDSRENLVFYLDGMETIDESFSNSTTQSSIASQINGFSDIGRELDFLLGSKKSGIAEMAENASASIGTAIGEIAGSLSENVGLGGGIIASLGSQGVSSVLNGGKITFPDIWADASFDKGYSITFKLRSPDNDSLSIFLNVLKPYCKLLCLVLPHAFAGNPNGYRTPFLVRAYSKGLFSVDMGMITGLSAVKGAACCWNDDGLPTQIDVTIELTDLYKQLYMSGYKDDDDSISAISSIALAKDASNVKNALVNNTAYMDFLANMAGLNINQMELLRRVKMFYYLMKGDINTIPSSLSTRFGQSLERAIGQGLYNF